MELQEERLAQIRASFGRSPMIQLFGAELKRIEKGYLEIELSKKDFMLRPAGMFNGAVIASLVDVSSGYAAVAAQNSDAYFTTVELKINYLNAAIGERLVAKAKVIKKGRVLTVVQSDVYAISGDEVDACKEIHAATSLVTMMRLEK